MAGNNFITSYVIIRNGKISLNGKTVFENAGPAIGFFNTAYEALGAEYPKFFKMDNLCKAGFLATEFLLKGKNLATQYGAENTGLVVSNKNSSLDTDIRYYKTLDANPSPSLFVYTLPSTIIGEICIRNQFKGETACFIFDIFDAAFQAGNVNGLLDSGRAKAVVSGWADFYNEQYEAFFYIVEKTNDNQNTVHNGMEVKKIYDQAWKL